MNQDSHSPSADSAPWRYPALEPVLPALPLGELTLIELGTKGGVTWLPVVLPLVTDALGGGRAVLYVVAGGDANPNPSCGFLCHKIDNPSLSGATDFTIHGCSPLGLGYEGPGVWTKLDDQEAGYDPSYIPTVSDMAAARAAHEQRHGPALLIVNDVQWVRPRSEDRLRQMDTALTLSDMPGPSNHHRHLARASDLEALAAMQPEAPTVVMWTGADEMNHGLFALRLHAVVHVAVELGADALHFTVQTRPSPADAWSEPSQLQGSREPDILTFLGVGDRPLTLVENDDDQSGD